MVSFWPDSRAILVQSLRKACASSFMTLSRPLPPFPTTLGICDISASTNLESPSDITGLYSPSSYFNRTREGSEAHAIHFQLPASSFEEVVDSRVLTPRQQHVEGSRRDIDLQGVPNKGNSVPVDGHKGTSQLLH